MRFAEITGWGMAVPRRALTNADLARSIPGVDDEWITRRTGIHSRFIASEGETTSTLATAAARGALERAGLDATQIDLIVVATCTPDTQIPSTAPRVQAALGAQRAGAFDVNAACAGFLTALCTADGLIRSGACDRVVVIGAEVMSRVLDWEDPKTCVLFGDGAGAIVLEACDVPAGVRSIRMGADGTGASLIEIPAGGSARPTSIETLTAREHIVRMNGPEVFRVAVRTMVSTTAAVIAAARITPADVDLLIVHQANQRIVDGVREQLAMPPERVFSNVARYGNTSAASVPIALCEAAEAGLLQPGETVVLTAVGAGLTWASAVVTWTAPTVRRERELAGMAQEGR